MAISPRGRMLAKHENRVKSPYRDTTRLPLLIAIRDAMAIAKAMYDM